MSSPMTYILRTLTLPSLIRALILSGLILASVVGFLNSAAQGAPDASASASKKSVYVISISGEVDPGMAAFVERAQQDVSHDPDALVVVKIDTFGGRVDSALEIVDTLLKIPENRSIAFVEKKAISAGAGKRSGCRHRL